MPGNPPVENIWFYQDFLAGTKYDFWIARPQDWTRLRVMDGGVLRPAMPAGHSGHPSQEQIKQLHAHAQKGELFLFDLGKSEPQLITETSHYYVDVDPKEPEKPQDLLPDASRGQQDAHQREMDKYEKEQKRYELNLMLANKFGAGLKKAIKSYNATRDMAWEKDEAKIRNSSYAIEAARRNRARADRVINDVFAPKPIAAPDIYYQTGHGFRDVVFQYNSFYEQMEPNGYVLPKNDKLDDHDAATIHLALFGANTHMEEVYRKAYPEHGPLKIQLSAPNGFHMLVTGMFGHDRVNQPHAIAMGHVMQRGNEEIKEYLGGNPGPLAKDLAECVRNIKAAFTNSSQNYLSKEFVAATTLTARLLNLFEKNPDLWEASGLQQEDREFMQGYVQMGKVFDNYLDGCLKFEDVEGHHQKPKLEERKQILADIVLRKMVERVLVQDNERVLASPAYTQEQLKTTAKEAELEAKLQAWDKENQNSFKDANERMDALNRFRLKNDSAQYMEMLINYPSEHPIIAMLAKPGMLERLREELLNDPALIEQAQQPHFGFGKNGRVNQDMLLNGSELNALADRLHPIISSKLASFEEKQAWFQNLKSAMEKADPEGRNRWIDPDVPTDVSRLAITQADGPKGRKLVSLANLLEGGMQALQNPDEKTLTELYRHALAGNLYFYGVGQEMPQRLTANGAETALEQMAPPKNPGFWKWLAHVVTFGYAFAEDFTPVPDRDPAARVAIEKACGKRKKVTEGETATHRKIVDDRAAQLRDETNKFQRAPEEGQERVFPAYDDNQLKRKLNSLETQDFMEEDDLHITREIINVVSDMRNILGNADASSEQIRRAVAGAVLLEAVKEEKAANKGGRPIAEGLKTNREGMIDNMVKTEAFQAFTKDASMDMLMHFIMVDGAKNMYLAMRTAAEKRNNQPSQQNNEIQKQNVNEREQVNMP